MFLLFQRLIPKELLGRIIYWAVRIRFAPLKNGLIKWFISHYEIDMDEVQEPDPHAFTTFNAFFTRALRPGARPISGGEDTLISPADGTLTQWGSLENGELVQAKGLTYTASSLLGPVPESLGPLTGGTYGTVYLAPHNYHRVHLPCAGTLAGMTLIPGKRYSVNDSTTKGIRNLFPGNERLVCWFETAWGPMATVLVGALNVATMSTVWAGEVTSVGRQPNRFEIEPQRFARGDEIGRFNLGSTVVFLIYGPTPQWSESLSPGQSIRMGQALCTLT